MKVRQQKRVERNQDLKSLELAAEKPPSKLQLQDFLAQQQRLHEEKYNKALESYRKTEELKTEMRSDHAAAFSQPVERVATCEHNPNARIKLANRDTIKSLLLNSQVAAAAFNESVNTL